MIEETKEPKLFDYVKAIFTKSGRLKTGNSFVSFVVLRAMSYNPHGIFYANALNLKSVQLDKQQIFDFLYMTVPENRIFSGKWGKREEEKEQIELIQTIFNVNERVAISYLKLLTQEEKHELHRKYSIGSHH